MSMGKNILHLGFSKTGTHWFNDQVYKNNEGVYLLTRKEVFCNLAFMNTFEYSPADTYRLFQDQSLGKRLVICDDILLGSLDIGFGSGEYVCMMANRLKETFGDASVVIFIRNQHEALVSAYSHYIKSGGTYSARKFLGIFRSHRPPFIDYHLFSPDLFDYSKIIGLYDDLFGHENVHVYLYEDFSRSPESFIQSFCEDLNLTINQVLDFQPQNVRLSAWSAGIMQFFNHFTSRNTIFKHYIFSIPRLYEVLISATGKLDRAFPALRPLAFSGGVHSWIDERFRMGNRELARWVNMEKLRKYGYPL